MTENSTVTRRAFMAGAAGMAGLGMAGLASTARAAESAKADKKASAASDAAWDEEADVVVVGLGAAGSAAAVEAIEAGAKVVVIEENGRGGGSTIVSGGLLYMGGTQLQKDLGIEDSVENMYNYIAKATGPNADPDLIRTFCDSSPELYDWLVSHGVAFEGDVDTEAHVVVAPQGVCLNYSGNERNAEYAAVADPAPRGHTPVGGGMGVFEKLEAIIDEKATVLYNVRGSEVVTDEAGAVIGVRGQDADGKTVSVKAAKGVVLSCGAFTYNDAMTECYDQAAVAAGGRTGVPNDQGDGILMGMAVGGAVKSMNLLNLQMFIYRYGDMPCGVVIDSRGLRFMAEDCYGTWIGRGIEKRSPEAAWIVLDQPLSENIADNLGMGDPTPVAQADTLEELAATLGVNADALTATIERYNSLVEGGEDVDYHKDVFYLKKVETAPFYAYDCSMPQLGYHTLGGLKINKNAEVISRTGEVIPGLYAAGRTSCGIYGEYPGSGSSIADGLTFGRIAGKQAAAR